MEELVSHEAKNWADLSPELFNLILQRVQGSRLEDGEGRRIVSLAGVCQRWRSLVHKACSVPLVQTGLLQFPTDLLQPGPVHSPLQCLLKRKHNAVVLYHAPDGAQKKREFLMLARRVWHPLGSRYIISTNRKRVCTSGPTYLGRLKSNFWRSEFILSGVKDGNIPTSDALLKSKGFSGRVRYAEHVVNGIRQRRIFCSLPQPSEELSSDVPNLCCHSPFTSCSCRSWSGWNCFTPHDEANRSPRSVYYQTEPETPVDGVITDAVKGDRVIHLRRDTSPPLDLCSKVPAWDIHQRCWSLDFKGRASIPSMHNFQIISASPSSLDLSTSTPSEDSIILQVGKIGKRLYTLDFCYPLSALQAFAISLSSFATNVGLDP